MRLDIDFMDDPNVFGQREIDLSGRARAALGDDLGSWLMKRVRARWYPRDTRLALAFIEEKIRDRSFFLYGAGSHSRALFEAGPGNVFLNNFRGFLDGRAEPGQTLLGYPVYPSSHGLIDDSLIVLSHHEFEDGMHDDLRAMGIPEQQIQPVYLDSGYGETALATISAGLARDLPSLSGPGLRFASVNARARCIVDGDAVARLGSGGNRQWFQVRMDRQETSSGAQGIASFDGQNSLGLCFFLLDRLDPDLIYVQEHYSSGNFLPLVLGLAYPETKIVAEFYDWLGLTFNDPFVLSRESYWRKQDVALAMAAERWCAANLAGLVTKEDGAPLDDYLAGGKVFKYQPGLGKTLFQEKKIDQHKPIKLVWAGTIAPSHLSPRMFGDNQLLDVFQKLIQMGFQVTAFTTAPDDRVLRDQYSDYLELAETSAGHFSIYPVRPRVDLIPCLAADFDFGLMLGIPKPNSQQGVSHAVTVSAKLHTYMAAGLPVIVGDYLKVMAAWTREHDIGIVVDHQRMEDLPEMITACCYAEKLEQVKRYREMHRPGRSIAALDRFFNEVSGKIP